MVALGGKEAIWQELSQFQKDILYPEFPTQGTATLSWH